MVTADAKLSFDAAFGAGVTLSEVVSNHLRMDAAAYSIEAREASKEISRAGYKTLPLFSESGEAAVAFASNGNRFSRVYVGESHGVPFMSSAEIISIDPPRDCFISRKLTERLDGIIIRPYDILISRSGTVGNVALAPRGWSDFALSEHAIRLRARDPDYAGYIACFLRSKWGRAQLVGHSYGSVVTHIETHHLQKVLVPDLPPILTLEIGRLFRSAADQRDEANSLLRESTRRLTESLLLPELEVVRGPSISPVKCRRLQGRLDASFHDPTANSIREALRPQGRLLGDGIGFKVLAVTKFRKRVYVETGGIPLYSSKQLFQVDPIDVKRLARGAHAGDLPEIGLSENMLCVSCSGTIGKVAIIPRYMEGWAANQHALRIVSDDPYDAGFLYTWLSSSYGRVLLHSESYGSVIRELDRYQLNGLLVPWPSRGERELIGEPVLEANSLRTRAWENEQKAIKKLSQAIGPPQTDVSHDGQMAPKIA